MKIMGQIHCKFIPRPVWQDQSNCDFVPGNHVDIWRIASEQYHDGLPDLLTFAERDRIQRYRIAADRQLRTAARAAVKMLVAKYAGIEPKQVIIELTHTNKPQLVGLENIDFNLSHSGKWILIAVSNSAVGVDVERRRPELASSNLIFSQAEARWVAQSANRTTAFFTLWTRKETLVKASGQGLIDEIPAVHCLDGSHPIPPVLDLNGDWQLQSFDMDDEYAAAVASVNSDLRFWDASLLF